jgi:hypothetical protein
MSDSDNTCAICFDTISIESLLSKKNENKPKKMMSLDCKHTYHINCIEEWAKKSNTCPICRNPIKKEEDIIIPQPQNTPIRQDQYVNVGHQSKKNKIVIISLILFVFAIINFVYFYTISYKYINDFKDYLSNHTMNCSIVVNEIVIDKDCPQLSNIDITFLILAGIVYVILIVFNLMTYSINKKISIPPFIIINTVCGVCIGLYYIMHFVSQFENINIYYTNNLCFNSSIERNFIISVVGFYICFIIYILTYIYV